MSLLGRLFGKKAANVLREDESFFFLSSVKGVIHIGANYGQERELYAGHGLRVLWVECLEDVFDKLRENLRGYPRQKAARALLTDKEGQEYFFNVSDNEGAASSSIFDFADHKRLWPEVRMTKTVQLRSATLPALLAQEGIAGSEFDALVMDTQGSELLILKGAEQMLGSFKFVKTEAADFEAYQGGCVLMEMDAFLKAAGFARIYCKPFAGEKSVGSYYEVVYKKE